MKVLSIFLFFQVFDCWGELVEIAEKMQQSCNTSQVHCTEDVIASLSPDALANLILTPSEVYQEKNTVLVRRVQKSVPFLPLPEVGIEEMQPFNLKELSDAEITAESVLRVAHNSQMELKSFL